MCANRVAVVTGGNKGIGFAIVKGLCERFEGLVYLTARDVGRGEAAVAKLRDLGLKAIFFQLDVTDKDSIHNFADYMRKEHNGIDLLVNNAGVQYKTVRKSLGQDRSEIYDLSTKDTRLEQHIKEAIGTLAVNYYGVLNVSESLFPLLRQHARIVNISSSSGHLSKIPSYALKKRLSSPLLNVAKLTELMYKYVGDVASGVYLKEGWGDSPYAVSKVAVSALTIVHQRKFDRERPYRNISVNCVHPGFVNTDMNDHMGPLTIEEGAVAPLFLALDDHDLRGSYIWCDKTEINWYADIL